MRKDRVGEHSMMKIALGVTCTLAAVISCDVKISCNINVFNLVPQEGFEPPTPSLRMTCSTS